MEPTQLEVLHEHYRDSCSVMQTQRVARDRCFYLVLGVISIIWFDVVAPRDFSTIAGEVLKARMQLSVAPDLGYLRSVLWFLLLGLVVRYFQTSLLVERSYDYIHDVEEVLTANVHKVFGREGKAYLSRYPVFLTWAHYLYVVAVPAVLLIVVAVWTRTQIPNWDVFSWSGQVWFNNLVSCAIIMSVLLYWTSRIEKKTADTSSAVIPLTPASRARQRRARS